MIEVPDIRQNEHYNCGDAAIDTALAALGVRRRRGTLLASPLQGMTPDTVAAILRKCGVAVWAGHVLTGTAGLRHLTQHGCPVLCSIAELGGHWVVVRGVTGGRRGRVHFHCPARGPQSRSLLEWCLNWHDWEGETGHEYRQWGIAAWVPR